MTQNTLSEDQKKLFAKKKSFKFRKVIPGWDWIEYGLVRLVVAFLNLFPLEWADWMARRVGSLAYYLMPKRRKIALTNLDIAFGGEFSDQKKKRIARKSFEHLAVSFVEFLMMRRAIRDAYKRFELDGQENLEYSRSLHSGAIYVISHLGAWEYLELLPLLSDINATVIVKKLRNPLIHNWITRLRKMTGVNVVDKDDGMRTLFRELRRNNSMAILIDQWAGPDGVWIDFFGTPTSTTSMPVKLAKKTGAGLIPMYCFRTKPGHYQIIIEQSIEVRPGDNWELDTTRALNENLEEQIRQYPEQWFWVHRRWKERPIPTKSR